MVQLVLPFTRGGVSCLTPKQVEELVSYSTSSPSASSSPTIFSFSVFDAQGAAKACSKLGVSYAAFCGYPDEKYKTIMTIRQADIGPHNAGPSTENAVVGDSDAGRSVLDLKGLVKHVTELRPTWCLPLYAPSNVEENPTKKSRTAASRTQKWFTGASQQPALNKIVAIPSSVVTSAQEDLLASCPLVFLDSAGQGETLGARTAALSRMVSSVVAVKSAQEDSSNPTDNANASYASHSPATTFVIGDTVPSILMAALTGVDLVECEYAGACARRGQAIDLSPLIRVIRGDSDVGDCSSSSYEFVMDLNDQKHQLDLRPFSPKGSCPCYSCRRHTKAYVYHLLSVQEMNSETILAIHNLSQLIQLCDAINTVRSQDGGDVLLKERIMKALNMISA